ncbi:MAG: BlaI/MecI/CopY family transcriptional regulator [Lachnospiraceae bacterium]
MAKKDILLNNSEWCIMEKIWQYGSRTLMELYNELNAENGWRKSTVNTLLQRMLEKGILGYEEEKRAKRYYARIKKEDAAIRETTSLLDRVYNGSVSMMMSTLVKKNALSREEILKLQELLQEVGEDGE